MYSESHFRFTPHSSKQIIKTFDILSIDICDNIIPFDAGSETQKVKSALQLLYLVQQDQVTRIIIGQVQGYEYVFMCRLYALTKQ